MNNKKLHIQALEAILRMMARAVLWKYHPTVVGITGSVGKTSTKEAVALVLSRKYRVRQNEKNYNNEIGIPLTILGMKTAGRSLGLWLVIAVRWVALMLIPTRYPEIIVLELGVDHPGDMQYLLSFIRPSVGVVTNIGSSHLEFFSGLDHIAKEKGFLLEMLPNDGLAVLNQDDQRVIAMKDRTKALVDTIGFSDGAHIQATAVQFNYIDEQVDGLSFKLNHEGVTLPVRLRHILATHQIYAALAAAAVGLHFKINLVESAALLEQFLSPPGRMNLIPGIKRTLIVDDTYNASPMSTTAALDVIREISAKRKIVALGDMLELGAEMKIGHKQVAEKITTSGIDLVFALGERMEIMVKELRQLGYPPDQIYYFDHPETAARKLQEDLLEGDLVLVKGSQSMRMEKVVEEIMAEPEKSEQLLCRQSPDWKKKPFVLPKMES